MNILNNVFITASDVERILNRFGNIGDNGCKLTANDLSKYKTAFIHKSCCSDEHHLGSYERYEFLGDAFISAAVAKYLIDRFPDQPEGFLTKMRAKLVRTSMLSHLARIMELNKYVIVSDDVKDSVVGCHLYEDCFEAFVGAIIQDFGDDNGYRYAKRFVLNIIENVVDFAEMIMHNDNTKDTLSRFFKYMKWGHAEYVELGDPARAGHAKAIFLNSSKVKSLPPQTRKGIIDFHKSVAKTTDKRVSESIRNRAKETNDILIGFGMANNRTYCEQKCSSSALTNLGVDENW